MCCFVLRILGLVARRFRVVVFNLWFGLVWVCWFVVLAVARVGALCYCAGVGVLGFGLGLALVFCDCILLILI